MGNKYSAKRQILPRPKVCKTKPVPPEKIQCWITAEQDTVECDEKVDVEMFVYDRDYLLDKLILREEISQEGGIDWGGPQLNGRVRSGRTEDICMEGTWNLTVINRIDGVEVCRVFLNLEATI